MMEQLIQQIKERLPVGATDDAAVEIIKMVQEYMTDRKFGFDKEQIAKVTGYDWDTLCSSTRKREIVQRRQLGMWLMSIHTKLSLAEIGMEFLYSDGKKLGKPRNHATVLHACNVIDNLLDTKQDTMLEMEANELNEFYLRTVKFRSE